MRRDDSLGPRLRRACRSKTASRALRGAGIDDRVRAVHLHAPHHRRTRHDDRASRGIHRPAAGRRRSGPDGGPGGAACSHDRGLPHPRGTHRTGRRRRPVVDARAHRVCSRRGAAARRHAVAAVAGRARHPRPVLPSRLRFGARAPRRERRHCVPWRSPRRADPAARPLRAEGACSARRVHRRDRRFAGARPRVPRRCAPGAYLVGAADPEPADDHVA